MPLALALAMTEQSEKAIRQKIMQEKSCSEMEAFCLLALNPLLIFASKPLPLSIK
jgi:hypothetical protein